MSIVKRFKSGAEDIVIKKYNYGLVVCYNYDYKSHSYVGYDSYYNTVEEAEAVLRKRRPTAIEQ